MGRFSTEQLSENMARLSANPYPGRGIVMGLSPERERVQQVYFLMGRSEPSRNRKLVLDGDVVRTEAIDPAKIKDPELLIYDAMAIALDNRPSGAKPFHIVSNGRQTTAIVEAKKTGGRVRDALDKWIYEPDKPNYTPRITGSISHAGLYLLSQISRAYMAGDVSRQTVVGDIQEDMDPGTGLCIHTYSGDGNPLPSFTDNPFPVPLGETVDDTADTFWDVLDRENRVALVVKGLSLVDHEVEYAFRYPVHTLRLDIPEN